MNYSVTLQNAEKTKLTLTVTASSTADAKMRAEVRQNAQGKGPWIAICATIAAV